MTSHERYTAEIRGRLRKYCLGLGLLISPILIACQISLHHVLAPLVPLFISEVFQTYLRFRDPTRVAKPPDKDGNLAVLGIVVLGYFTYNAFEVKNYIGNTVAETVAASIALLIFRRLKLDRNPIGENKKIFI